VTVEIKWEKNDKGQFVPKEVPGTEKTRPAQLVLLAMGFLGPEQALLKELNVETDPRSNIKAEHEKYTTSIKGIFAAGDCRRGQSLVVWAINEGRGAAIQQVGDDVCARLVVAQCQQRRRIKEVVRHSRSLSACLSCISLSVAPPFPRPRNAAIGSALTGTI
jgi:pyruvate/2-oxoglutarate dehydrogenase complex dihydrolipoamide dehydrogenase (E3) component